MEECKGCKCFLCNHRMNEIYEARNNVDCTMCSWCKGDLHKKECSNCEPK
jgi:hypothetical protein